MAIKKENIAIYFLIIIVFLLNIYHGYPRLASYSSVDEPYWTYDRTPDYWKNIKERDWKGTKINDKPGITVALISGVGLLFKNPMETRYIRRRVKTLEQVDQVQKMDFIFRFPIYLFSLISLFLYYVIFKKLINKIAAVAFLIMLGLSPLILGISLIINPDSLLWIFLPLCILSLLLYQKNDEKKYLYLSGIMLGLSVLTKYVANILYIFILLHPFIDYWFIKNKKMDAYSYFKKASMDYLRLVVVSVLTFILLFPATWVNYKTILGGTILSRPFKPIAIPFIILLLLLAADIYLLKAKIIQKIFDSLKNKEKYFFWVMAIITLFFVCFALFNTYTGMKTVNFESNLASPKSSSHYQATIPNLFTNISSDYYALIFGLTPVCFILFIFGSVYLIKNYKKEEYLTSLIMTLSSFIFIFLYYLGSSFSGIGATVRYQIALYPLAIQIAAVGFWLVLDLIKKKGLSIKFLSLTLLLIFSAASLFFIKPFYFAYASSLLPKQYVLNLKDMGDGNHAAGQMMNKFPNAAELTVWSDKGGFCESFVGRCVSSFKRNDVEGINFDYFVVSAGRKSKSLKSVTILTKYYNMHKLYDTETFDYRIAIGGRENNFVKIVSAEKVMNQ
jgi:hypothetical protein